MRLPILIVTDLDGTLLDHHHYSAAPALPLLRQLDYLEIPWVLNTSKTAVELQVLRDELGNRHPFIVENGAAAFIPDGYFDAMPLTNAPRWHGYHVHAFGPPRQALLTALAPHRTQFAFEALSDLSVNDMVAHTGLPPESAAHAMQRQYTEPLIWRDSDPALACFTAALEAEGLKVVRGGRFVHVMGPFDKGQAMAWLAACYQKQWRMRPYTVALGDSENDRAMLHVADHAVVIRSPVHEPLNVPHHPNLVVTDATGPAGWAHAIGALLNRHGLLATG